MFVNVSKKQYTIKDYHHTIHNKCKIKLIVFSINLNILTSHGTRMLTKHRLNTISIGFTLIKKPLGKVSSLSNRSLKLVNVKKLKKLTF